MYTNANSHAASEKQQKELEDVTSKLEQEQQKVQSLKQQAEKAETNLNKTKEMLVNTASEINRNEREREKTSASISKLTLQKEQIKEDLEKDRALIGSLILGLKKLKQTPPQALLFSPQKPYKTAQTALLLRDIIPSVNKHAKSLENNLTTLNTLTTRLKEEEETLAQQASELENKKTKLTKLLQTREKLFEKTNQNLSDRKAKIKKISLKATDLKDLVQKLKKQEEQEAKERKQKFNALKPHIQARKPEINTPQSNGAAYQPVVGVIKIGFNQKDNLGAKAKGLTFEGRADALVVAPIGGKVQFTGAFKKYGNIVIIEHQKNYHSLIAGLDKITTTLGAELKSGEPIGTLPNSSLNPRPTLYYELRKNGKPVNPERVLQDGIK